jgi:hypothetical protein
MTDIKKQLIAELRSLENLNRLIGAAGAEAKTNLLQIDIAKLEWLLANERLKPRGLEKEIDATLRVIVEMQRLVDVFITLAELEDAKQTIGRLAKTIVSLYESRQFADARLAEANQRIRGIRAAVARYMQSEGCTCCEDIHEHEKNTRELAGLLQVPLRGDELGYDFRRYL